MESKEDEIRIEDVISPERHPDREESKIADDDSRQSSGSSAASWEGGDGRSKKKKGGTTVVVVGSRKSLDFSAGQTCGSHNGGGESKEPSPRPEEASSSSRSRDRRSRSRQPRRAPPAMAPPSGAPPPQGSMAPPKARRGPPREPPPGAPNAGGPSMDAPEQRLVSSGDAVGGHGIGDNTPKRRAPPPGGLMPLGPVAGGPRGSHDGPLLPTAGGGGGGGHMMRDPRASWDSRASREGSLRMASGSLGPRGSHEGMPGGGGGGGGMAPMMAMDPRGSWESHASSSAGPMGGPMGGPAAAPVLMVERRVDYRDGVAYSYADFVAEYKDQAPAEWAAAPLAPPGYPRHYQQHHAAGYQAAPQPWGPPPGGAGMPHPHQAHHHHQAHPQPPPPLRPQPAPFVDTGVQQPLSAGPQHPNLNSTTLSAATLSTQGDVSPSGTTKSSSSESDSSADVDGGGGGPQAPPPQRNKKDTAPVAVARDGPAPFQRRDPNRQEDLHHHAGSSAPPAKKAAGAGLEGYTKCLVKRDREGVTGRLYPTFNLYVQDDAPPGGGGGGGNLKPAPRLVMQAQKQSGRKTSHYRFFDMTPGKRVGGSKGKGKRMSKKASNYVGKMRGNFNRDEYEVVAAGDKEGGPGGGSKKEVLASLVYDKCDLLAQVRDGASPRKMGLLLPAAAAAASSGGGSGSHEDDEATDGEGKVGEEGGGGAQGAHRSHNGMTPEERLAAMVSGLGGGQEGTGLAPATPRSDSLVNVTRRWRLEDLNNYDLWAVRSRKEAKGEVVARVKRGHVVEGQTSGDGWLELSKDDARKLGCPFDRGLVRLRVNGEGWLPLAAGSGRTGPDGMECNDDLDEVDAALACALRSAHTESPAGVHTKLMAQGGGSGGGSGRSKPQAYRQLQSKDPVFEKGNYRLNFHGRVKLPSVKNYQLVPPEAIDDVWTQFGKVTEDEFHLDFKAPLTPLVAFAVAISQFDY